MERTEWLKSLKEGDLVCVRSYNNDGSNSYSYSYIQIARAMKTFVSFEKKGHREEEKFNRNTGFFIRYDTEKTIYPVDQGKLLERVDRIIDKLSSNIPCEIDIANIEKILAIYEKKEEKE